MPLLLLWNTETEKWMKLFLSLTTPYLTYFTIKVITCMQSHESWLKQCTIITEDSDTVDQLIATNCRPRMYSQNTYSSDLKICSTHRFAMTILGNLMNSITVKFWMIASTYAGAFVSQYMSSFCSDGRVNISNISSFKLNSQNEFHWMFIIFESM